MKNAIKLFLAITSAQLSLLAEQQKNFKEIRDNIINKYSCTDNESCKEIKNFLTIKNFKNSPEYKNLKKLVKKSPKKESLEEPLKQLKNDYQERKNLLDNRSTEPFWIFSTCYITIAEYLSRHGKIPNSFACVGAIFCVFPHPLIDLYALHKAHQAMKKINKKIDKLYKKTL